MLKKQKYEKINHGYFLTILYNWLDFIYLCFSKVTYIFKNIGSSFYNFFLNVFYVRFCQLNDPILETNMKGWMMTVMDQYGPTMNKQQFLYYTIDYFDALYSPILLSRYFDKIIVNNQNIFEIYIDKANECISVHYLGIINIILRHNITKEVHRVSFHSSHKIQLIFDYVEKNYGIDFIDLSFETKRLGNLREQTLSSLNIQNDSELTLIVGKIVGGENTCLSCGATDS